METVQKPDLQYLEKLNNITTQPIFILGLHRSGTSILYKVLTATGAFNPVTAYHIMRYDQLMKNHIENTEETEKNNLTESFKKEGLDDRKVDSLKLSADFEEEYGFLLGQYTQNMVINRKTVALFEEMCKKIQFIAENNKPILLKNPFDFTKFLYIKQVFPHAKFIFTHRHPLPTVSSNLKAIRSVFEDKNPYTAALSNIYDMFYSNPIMLPFLRYMYSTVPEIGVFLITRFCSASVKFFLRNIGKIPETDYTTVGYEEFCRSPRKIIDNIMKTFSLKMVNDIDVASYISPREAPIDIKVRKMRRHIYSSMKNYSDRFHYTLEEFEEVR
jgi:hypothetical protein